MSALGDFIPVGSTIEVHTRHPEFDLLEPPPKDTAGITNASVTYTQSDGESITLTLPDEIQGQDTEGVLGNNWDFLLLIYETIPSGSTRGGSIDIGSQRFTYLENDFIIFEDIGDSWEDLAGGTWSATDTSFSPDVGLPILAFSGGTGGGISSDLHASRKELDFLSQNTQYEVVRNEVQGEEFSHSRRLTMVPRRRL